VVDIAPQRLRIKALASFCLLLPVKGVRFGKAGEGLIVPVRIVQQRTESEPRGDPIRCCPLGALQHCSQALQLCLVARLLSGAGEAPMRVRQIGVELERAMEARQGLLEMARDAQDIAEPVPCRGVVGGE